MLRTEAQEREVQEKRAKLIAIIEKLGTTIYKYNFLSCLEKSEGLEHGMAFPHENVTLGLHAPEPSAGWFQSLLDVGLPSLYFVHGRSLTISSIHVPAPGDTRV